MILSSSRSWQRALARARERGVVAQCISRQRRGYAETIRYRVASHSHPGRAYTVVIHCDGYGTQVRCNCPAVGACQHAAAALADVGLLDEDDPVSEPSPVDGRALLARLHAERAEADAYLSRIA